MKVRLLTTVCCLAAIGSLLQGCAGGATRPEPPAAAVAAAQVDIGNLPQMMMPDASSAQIKPLAMGAARSKGWILSESASDRLVVKRPLDPSTLAALPSNVPVSSDTLMEVTSFFIDQSGGVNVATKAELVSQMPGQPSPTRIDYTENFREPLTQSLYSLRDAWSRHRGRLARAAPPEGGWKDAWSDNQGMAGAGVSADNQMTVEVDPVGDEQPAQLAQTPPAPLPVDTPQPVRPAPEPLRPAAPEPRRSPAGGAPVVDASSSSNRNLPARTASQTNMAALPNVRTPAARPPVQPASVVKVSTAKPPAAPATVAKPAATAATKVPAARSSAPAGKTPATKASTVPATAAKTPATKTAATKPAVPASKASAPKASAAPAAASKTQTAKTVAAKPAAASPPAAKKINWSAAAEKYARQKGCKVTGKGAQLIESRKDGEVHKIACTGADSVLVKCQNGTCKGLL